MPPAESLVDKPRPIRDAIEAAAREASGAEADATAAREAEEAERERLADIASIRRAFKKGALKGAIKVGAALGWSKAEVEELLTPAEAPPAKPPRPPRDAPPAGDDDDGEGGGEPGGSGDGGDPDKDAPPTWLLKKRPVKPLPETCPVRPLGSNGGRFFYLNPRGEFFDMDTSDHSAMGLRALFGDVGWLWSNFPKFREPKSASDLPKHTGWKADEATESLFGAQSRLPIFDPDNRVRGRGGWRDSEGRLILHCGDRVIIGGESGPPRQHERLIYPAETPCPHPADTFAPQAAGALMADFDGWAWKGLAATHEGLPHSLGSILLTGWIAGAMLGGALKWRPMVWLTGGAGTGKSTLQDIIQGVLGEYLMHATDASGPSIWQTLKYASIPVALDEMENDPDSPKNKAIIKLARAAASGGKIARGSQNGQASTFEARSSMLFSSIIIPPMLGQDVSRFCILELEPLGERKRKAPPAAELARIGRIFLRALIDHWGRWQETLDEYSAHLAQRGHTQRDADVWGTLLAAADMVMGKERLDGDSIAILAAHIPPADRERVRDELAMVNHLATKPLNVFRGGNVMTVGQLVAIASGLVDDPNDQPATPRQAAEALRGFSIFVNGHGREARMTLPNQSAALNSLFQHTQWGGAAGADGGWSQAMRRLDERRAENSSKLGGRGWSVPARIFLQLEDTPTDFPATD